MASAQGESAQDESAGMKLETGPVERVPTGIPGFDEMIEGGIPRNSTVLLSGSCGTGKSSFAMQFILEGARRGEPGVYITLEEEPAVLARNMALYGWELRDHIQAGRIVIVKPELYELDALIAIIGRTVEGAHAKRLAIDSFTLISTYLESPYEVRKALVRLSRDVKKLGCTTLALSDIRESAEVYSTTGFEEFIADGVILLSLTTSPPSTNYVRAVFVRKLRATNHSLKHVPFALGPGGVTVYPQAEIFGP